MNEEPDRPFSQISSGSKSEKHFIFPQETIDSVRELGVIFQRTHERMVAEGYTIIDGKIVNADGGQKDDINQPYRTDSSKGDSERQIP
jgi:hypothetical protein